MDGANGAPGARAVRPVEVAISIVPAPARSSSALGLTRHGGRAIRNHVEVSVRGRGGGLEKGTLRVSYFDAFKWMNGLWLYRLFRCSLCGGPVVQSSTRTTQ